jgi:hypothetical protein
MDSNAADFRRVIGILLLFFQRFVYSLGDIHGLDRSTGGAFADCANAKTYAGRRPLRP